MAATADTAYLDCFSGISGDMLLGALLDCGLSEEALYNELRKLDLDPFTLKVSRQTRQSIDALSVRISSETDQQFRNLATISELLERSSLDGVITSRALRVFRRLAEAEAKVHGKPVDEIHFHEVGALDTIIDVVGVVAGLHLLGITTLHCAPLPLGRGFVECAHGRLPLPAPAVCELLENIPVVGIAAEQELVTPTGAALVAELTDRFGPLPPMIITATGYGAGDSPGTPDRPNLLRIISGRLETVAEAQLVEVIETSLDDWNPEGFPYLCEKLLDALALDVNLTPMQMKKGRPGFRLTVVCRPVDAPALKDILFSETSAIGVRFRTEQRLTLARRVVPVETRWGPVLAKEVVTPSGTRIYPEYESCKETAIHHKVPLDRVYREVIANAGETA